MSKITHATVQESLSQADSPEAVSQNITSTSSSATNMEDAMSQSTHAISQGSQSQAGEPVDVAHSATSTSPSTVIAEDTMSQATQAISQDSLLQAGSPDAVSQSITSTSSSATNMEDTMPQSMQAISQNSQSQEGTPVPISQDAMSTEQSTIAKEDTMSQSAQAIGQGSQSQAVAPVDVAQSATSTTPSPDNKEDAMSQATQAISQDSLSQAGSPEAITQKANPSATEADQEDETPLENKSARPVPGPQAESPKAVVLNHPPLHAPEFYPEDHTHATQQVNGQGCQSQEESLVSEPLNDRPFSGQETISDVLIPRGSKAARAVPPSLDDMADAVVQDGTTLSESSANLKAGTPAPKQKKQRVTKGEKMIKLRELIQIHHRSDELESLLGVSSKDLMDIYSRLCNKDKCFYPLEIIDPLRIPQVTDAGIQISAYNIERCGADDVFVKDKYVNIKYIPEHQHFIISLCNDYECVRTESNNKVSKKKVKRKKSVVSASSPASMQAMSPSSSSSAT